MKAGTSVDARRACAEFLALASGFYRVSTPGIRVLAARPLKVRESWTTELFGDYNPETMLIRLWMRTAVRTLTFSISHFRIHGTLAVSTSAPLRCTTMHGGRRQSDCSGCQYRAGAGGSIGVERIAVRDPSGFRGGNYLCSIYRNVRLIRG
jgi:hypothetical protein